MQPEKHYCSTIEYVDWETFFAEIAQVSSQVDFQPDIIVGIVRGGIIPARLLASKLHVKDMYCLTIKKVGTKRIVTSEIREDLKNKNILLVEDMLETGKSLIAAKKYFEKKKAIVKTACLYIMPKSEITSDFYLKKVNKIVQFPWE